MNEKELLMEMIANLERPNVPFGILYKGKKYGSMHYFIEEKVKEVFGLDYFAEKQKEYREAVLKYNKRLIELKKDINKIGLQIHAITYYHYLTDRINMLRLDTGKISEIIKAEKELSEVNRLIEDFD